MASQRVNASAWDRRGCTMAEDTRPGSRSRTVSWADIHEIGAHARKEDYLQGWAEGRYPPPPICESMGIRLVEVGRGRAVFTGTPAEYHYNPMGTVHGGMLSTLIDSACGIACMSLLPHGSRWTTVNLSVSFFRVVTEATGLIRCEGVAVHHGRKIVVADATILSPDGEQVASGRATCLVLDAPR
ncbi:PaaI family thioesterase [Archangium violaceum]|nr:PaaI family thioesterase [Archangium violaceum]